MRGAAGEKQTGFNGSTIANRLFFANLSVEELFRQVYSRGRGGHFYSQGAIFFETSQNDKYRRPSIPSEFESWRRENLHCVDLVVKPEQAKDLLEIFKKALEDHFQLKASIEEREVPCLILKKANNGIELATKGEKPILFVSGNDEDRTWTIRNKPFSKFLENFKPYFSSKNISEPFIDLTGITTNVDMTINWSFFNKFKTHTLEDVNKALLATGLKLVKERHLTRVLVIRDKR